MKEENRHRCYLAMGGNMGNVAETFADALRLLEETDQIRLIQFSSSQVTAAVGENALSDVPFLNGACEIQTSLAPIPLLDCLQQIEDQLGRERTLHWGPRTIDLDIILYDDQIINEPRLQVPHIACWYRRFVLDPLAEIAGEIVHPTKNITIQQLQKRLLQQPFSIAIAGKDASTRDQLILTNKEKFPDIVIEHWTSSSSQQSEPTLLVWLGNEFQSNTGSINFESLPLLPRIDLSQVDDLEQSIFDIICAATNQ